jgi:hypothetical protein
MSAKDPDLRMGTATPQGIRATERSWIPYRDAWAALGAKVRPDVRADAWKAWLTRDRCAMLREFTGEHSGTSSSKCRSTRSSSLGFMIVSNIYTTVGYFVHERIWARIGWGTERRTA